MQKATLRRRGQSVGSGALNTILIVASVGLLAVPSVALVGRAAHDVTLGPAFGQAAAESRSPVLTQHVAAMSGGTVARVVSRAAAKLAEVTARLDSLGELAEVAHYAPVPRHLDSPYFNIDVSRAMSLRQASGTNAPGYQLAQKVAQSLQRGLDPESIARAAGDDRTVRMVADVLEDVRRNYGRGEFDAHEFVPGGYWDWTELDHVLHYVAEPLEPYANWAGPGPNGWLRGKEAGRFAIIEGQPLTPLQRRLQTYRKLFESKGVSDEVRQVVFPSMDDATWREIRVLQNKRASLLAEVEAEELQQLTKAMAYMSPDIVETLKRLLGGRSDETLAQRQLVLAALEGDVDIVGLEPSQIAARVRNRVRAGRR